MISTTTTVPFPFTLQKSTSWLSDGSTGPLMQSTAMAFKMGGTSEEQAFVGHDMLPYETLPMHHS